MEQALLVLVTVLANGAVTYGVIKTQLAWLRRDVDLAHERINKIEERLQYAAGRRQLPAKGER